MSQPEIENNNNNDPVNPSDTSDTSDNNVITEANDNIENGGETSSSAILGRAFYETLLPIAEDYTAHVNEVIVTQQHLSENIDSLVVDLNRVKNSLANVPLFNVYTKKLLTSRTKVEALGRTLATIESRINKMTTDIRRNCPDAFTSATASSESANEVPEEITRVRPQSPQKQLQQ